ncbi:MAG: hypothetical protein Kow0063_28830 [Anaerolineae bacterium]
MNTNGWTDYLVKQEQYRDQLREAERQRLARLVAGGCQGSTLGQAVGRLASRIIRGREPSPRQGPCGEYNHLVEKAA